MEDYCLYVFSLRLFYLAESNVSIALRTRATSSATLLSEVISLTRLRPPGRNKHTRLRESMDCETEHDAEDECNNDSGVVQAYVYSSANYSTSRLSVCICMFINSICKCSYLYTT